MRKAFGQTFDLRPGYLNTASVGIPPTTVADLMHEAISRWSNGSAQPPDYDKHIAVARDAWARLIGVPTATVAIGAGVAQLTALVVAGLPADTRVLTVGGEFTSVTFPFAARGLRVTEVGHAELAAAARDHDLVAVSVVQSADGTVADLDALRETGKPVLLDISQAGWLPMRLDWADWVVGAGYKWLLSPRGAAWLAVRPDRLAATVPAAANWYAGEDPWNTAYGLPLRLASDARRLDISPAWHAQVGAAAALSWLLDLDFDRVREHCVRLANATLTGLDLPPGDSAIISLDLSEAAARRLAASGVVASVRAGRTRLSFHLYNDDEDVDLVVGALRGAG